MKVNEIRCDHCGQVLREIKEHSPDFGEYITVSEREFVDCGEDGYIEITERHFCNWNHLVLYKQSVYKWKKKVKEE